MKYDKEVPVMEPGQPGRNRETGEYFAIHRIENLQQDFRQHAHPHRHACHALVLFTSGSGVHHIDFKDYQVMPGQMYFINQGQVHYWQVSADATGYCLFFSPAFFELHAPAHHGLFQFPFFFNFTDKPFIQLTEKQQVEMLEVFCLAEREGNHSQRTEDSLLVLWSYLHILLLKTRQFYQHAVPAGQGPGFHLVQEFELKLQEHFRKWHSVNDYAEMLHVTPNYLNALSKKLLGKNAKAIINDRLVLEAKRMLANTAMGVSEVAWQLNFKDTSYFSRFFRKNTGHTPEAFRTSVHQ